jgi:hypothetical protein
MSKKSKLREKILSGDTQNIDFVELCTFVQQIGFNRGSGDGSHRKFSRDGVREFLDLQRLGDGSAKAYQVRQVRDIVRRYNL